MNLMMFKEVILTADEAQFLEDAERSTQPVNLLKLKKIIIEMYSIKHAEKNTYALINSNKELAKSNEEHAQAMRYITSALVFVAVVQIVVAGLALYLNL